VVAYSAKEAVAAATSSVKAGPGMTTGGTGGPGCRLPRTSPYPCSSLVSPSTRPKAGPIRCCSLPLVSTSLLTSAVWPWSLC
jgi:hypothetical protein